MRHRGVLVLAGLAGALALVVSLSVAAAGGAGKSPAKRSVAAAVKPPKVAVSRTKLLDRYTYLALAKSTTVGRWGARP